jgi:hypothetical protein
LEKRTNVASRKRALQRRVTKSSAGVQTSPFGTEHDVGSVAGGAAESEGAGAAAVSSALADPLATGASVCAGAPPHERRERRTENGMRRGTRRE